MVVLLSLSVASAADDATFTDLASEINATEEGSTLVLNVNYTYNSTTDNAFVNGIVINKNLTIDGNGFTIDGANDARIFQITNGNVILKNINFVNGYSTSRSGGGAIYASANDLTIDSCTFENCNAYYQRTSRRDDNSAYGGAIHLTGNYSLITSSIFMDCSASTRYQGRNTDSYGGAIASNNVVTVYNCIFESNNNARNGKAIYVGTQNIGNTLDNNFFAVSDSISNWVSIYRGSVSNLKYVKLVIDETTTGYTLNFVLNDESSLTQKVPDYLAILTINDQVTVITIENNSFSGDLGSELYNLNVKSTLGTTLASKQIDKRLPIEFYVEAYADDVILRPIVYNDNVFAVVTFNETVNGTISVRVGRSTGTFNVVNGKANFTITRVSVGNHTIYVTFNGNDKYQSAQNSTTFTVQKADPKVNVLVGPSYNITKSIFFGDEITVRVEGIPYGINYIYITLENGTEERVRVNRNVATTTITDLLNPGLYNLKVRVPGNSNYNELIVNDLFLINTDVNITVSPLNPSAEVIVYGDSAVVTIQFPKGVTGSVRVSLDAMTWQTAELDENSSATFVFDNLNAGTHTVVVGYNHLLTFKEFTVFKANPELTVVSEDIVYGENATIIVYLPEDATGTVTVLEIRDDISIEHTANVTDGKAVVVIEGLTAGTSMINVTYNGDSNYNVAKAQSTLTVYKADAFVNIDAPAVVYGENATITVYVPLSADGLVNVTVAGKTYVAQIIEDGKAVVVIDKLPADNYKVDAVLWNDPNYNDAANSSTLTVEKTNANMLVLIPIIIYGKNGTFIVTLNEDATGKVFFSMITPSGAIIVYSKEVIGGKVLFDVDGLKAGNYNVTLTYTGDNNYYDDNVSIPFNVFKAAPNVDIDSPAIVYGENATITVYLPEDATGTVTVLEIRDDISIEYTANVTDGKAVVVIEGLTAGTSMINVTYNGDSNYMVAKAQSTLTVYKADAFVNIDAPAVVYGENATITVYVPSSAEGLVNVTVANKTYVAQIIEDGKAVVVIDKLPAGNYKVDAVLWNDPNYNDAANSSTLTVKKIKPNMEIVFNPEIIYSDDTLIITAVLPIDATGNVTFVLDNKTTTIALEDGYAEYIVSNLPADDYLMIVSYSGDNNYSNSSKISSFEVIPSIKLFAYDLLKFYTNPEPFTVVLTEREEPLVNKTIKFTILNKTYIRTTDENGVARLNINLQPGIYDITTQYEDLTIENEIRVFSCIYAYDLVKIYKSDEPYTVQIADNEGEVLVDTDVAITILGKTYIRTTDEVGIASLNINLGPGTYTVSAVHPITGEVVTNNITVLPNIVSQDVVKYYKNGTQYKVRVLKDFDKGFANQTVSITILGKTYTRITDEEGYATLNINLGPGEYDVTASYGALSVSNKVTVLNNLKSQDVVKYYKNGTQYKVRLLENDDKGIANETVAITIGGKTYYKITDEEGYATLNINLGPGIYDISASYGSCSVSNTITVLSTLETKDLVKNYGTPDPFVCKLVDGTGAPICNETVSFNILGKTYSRITDEMGIAKLNINLVPGNYVISSTYGDLTVSNNVIVKI